MKTSIYIASSANGFISNARNAPYWLSPEYGMGFAAICEQKKAVIMGRTTYDILAPDYLPLKNEGSTVVLTTNANATSNNPTVVFTKNEPTDILDMLTQRGHTEAVIIGGMQTISEFIQAELVDDIYLVVEPVIFGDGLSLLKTMPQELKLSLLELTKLNDHTVQLHYKIEK